MKKEAIKIVGKVLEVASVIVFRGAIIGGSWVMISAITKRYSPNLLKKAAKLACERDLSEGEIQEIICYDVGIPFLVKGFFTEVAMYIVVKIKKDGQYKMCYIGSRSITLEEAECYSELV